MADMKWSPEAWARLGAVIRKSREERGLSRKKLSELSGVSEKSIQLTEEGRVPTRWPKSLHALEDALGWAPGSVMDVLDGGEASYRAVSASVGQLGAASPGWFELARHDQQEEERARRASTFTETSTRTKAALSRYGFASQRDIELTQSGHLAQDVFLRQAKRYRKLRGVSVEELVKRAGDLGSELSAEGIRHLEDGKRLLRVTEATAIANALETTVEWLLGSGFSDEAPEEMRWPPNDKELEAEANAVMRRIAEASAQLNAARQQAEVATQREASARAEADMAMAMVQSLAAQQREMEKNYQYLLGRIDSIRAARGEETAIQLYPLYEEDGQ